MKNLEEWMNELWEKSRHTALSPYHMGLYNGLAMSYIIQTREKRQLFREPFCCICCSTYRLPMCKQTIADKITNKLAEEYEAAVEKHPEFPSGQAAASIIAEELGELARELNDAWACIPGAQERALIEAAHVAVTAIRTMEMLTGAKK